MTSSLRYWLIGTGLLSLASGIIAAVAFALPPGSTPRELELGAEAAEDIEKSVILVEDEEKLAKLQAMIDQVAAASPRPEIEYRIKIVATPGVNAFVLPGGYVYVTTGLMGMVESDDELMGVLCHEVAHNVQQHAITRMREAPLGKLGLMQLATLVAQVGLVVSGAPEGALLADAASRHITSAVLNPGSVANEVEADLLGIDYMIHTDYNPVGFLTFLERLASTSGKFFEQELGIHNTHPLTRDRVKKAKERLEARGVPILRRLVTDVPQPEWSVIRERGEDLIEVRFDQERVLLLAGTDETRGELVANAIGWALDHELTRADLQILPGRDRVFFGPADGKSFELYPADGAANGGSEVELAANLRTWIDTAVRAEQNRIRANYQFY